MEFLTNKTRSTVHVHAYDNGKPVGSITLTENHLDEIWVRPDLRGKGYGKALAQYAISIGAKSALIVSDAFKHIAQTFGWHSHDGVQWIAPN